MGATASRGGEDGTSAGGGGVEPAGAPDGGSGGGDGGGDGSRDRVETRGELSGDELCRAWEEVLDGWSEEHSRSSNAIRELVWTHGVPSAMRGRVWPVLAGWRSAAEPDAVGGTARDVGSTSKAKSTSTAAGSNYAHSLEVGKAAYEYVESVMEASEAGGYADHEHSERLLRSARCIRLDVVRERHPQFDISSDEGAMQRLVELLLAHAVSRADQTYTSGMSSIAVWVVKNIKDGPAALHVFCKLLDTHALSCYWSDVTRSEADARVGAMRGMLETHMPELMAHMDRLSVHANLFLYTWLVPLFSRTLPVAAVERCYDVLLFEADGSAMMTLLIALCHVLEPELLAADSMQTALTLLHKTPIVSDAGVHGDLCGKLFEKARKAMVSPDDYSISVTDGSS